MADLAVKQARAQPLLIQGSNLEKSLEDGGGTGAMHQNALPHPKAQLQHPPQVVKLLVSNRGIHKLEVEERSSGEDYPACGRQWS